MNKKDAETPHDLEEHSAARPRRMHRNTVKISSRQKKSAGSRKSNKTEGMHLRGDKRVNR